MTDPTTTQTAYVDVSSTDPDLSLVQLHRLASALLMVADAVGWTPQAPVRGPTLKQDRRWYYVVPVTRPARVLADAPPPTSPPLTSESP